MRHADFTTAELTQITELLGNQMLTAERVLTTLGHDCGLWHVVNEGSSLVDLTCLDCGASADIHLVDGTIGARYTVLLLPPGSCPSAPKRLTDQAASYGL